MIEKYSKVGDLIIGAANNTGTHLTESQESAIRGAVDGIFMGIGAVGIDTALKNINNPKSDEVIWQSLRG